jgi:thymidylate synthase
MEDLRENPDSRRLMVTAWNPSDLDKAVLPPCHYGFQVYTRELSQSERFNWYGNKIGSHMHHDHIEQEMNARNVPTRAISLMWNQRSVDVPLGLPFNIASYGALLMMLADEMQMVPDELIANLGDCHIYLNQVDGCKEQLGREPYKLPTLRIQDGMYSRHVEDFILEGYVSHPSIKFPLSN